MNTHVKAVAWFAWSNINRIGNLGQYIDLYTGPSAPQQVVQSDRPRLVVVYWWQGQTQSGYHGLDDLGWADLVICITPELVPDRFTSSWDQFRSTACQRL